jgi:myo-inositol 2-dehydrogenase/D-chiro-inositol 1-dehydrogenase
MNELNRRDFLAGSIAVALPHMASAQASAEPVTVGMIGTGARGSFLLSAILPLPGVTIKALCDIKPDRLDKAASMAAQHNPATYSDYRKILERKDIQAVWIATPCDLHVEMAIAALHAGKHIYLEKPVGITPESIRELLKAAKGRKTVFQTGHVMRSYPYLKTGVARVQQGVAGKVIMIRAWRHSSSAFNPNPNMSSADWYYDVKRSGDLIVENAIHNLDVCNWFAGSRPEFAAGFGGTMLKNEPPGRINTDGYTLSYEYANGVKLSFTQLCFHPSGLPYGGQGFQIYGTEGAVEVVYANVGKTIFYGRTRGAKPEVLSESADDAPQGYHFQAFFDAVRSGKTDVPGGLEVGAIAALTSIMGREAFTRKKMMTWREMAVEL